MLLLEDDVFPILYLLLFKSGNNLLFVFFSSLSLRNTLPQHGISGEGNGNPLQYSCLENSVDKGAWWAAVHRVAQSRT